MNVKLPSWVVLTKKKKTRDQIRDQMFEHHGSLSILYTHLNI